MWVTRKRYLGLGLVVAALGGVWVAPVNAEPAVTAPPGAVEELVGERTAAGRTWELASGERVTRMAAQPIHWKDRGGTWRGFDGEFVRLGAAFRAQVGPDALVAPVSRTGWVRLGDGPSVSFRLDGVSGDAQADGDGALRYQAGRDAEVRLEPVLRGVKETVLLRSTSAPVRWTWQLRVSDEAHARVTDSGDVEITDGRDVQFRVPAPVIFDAEGAQMPGAEFELERGGAGWELSVAVAPGWLRAPGRAFPVSIDPTVEQAVAQSETEQSSSPEASRPLDGRPNHACPTLQPTVSIGRDFVAGRDRSWAMRWPTLSSIGGGNDISRATLKLTRTATTVWSGQQAPGRIDAWRISAGWTPAPNLASVARDLRVWRAARGAPGAVNVDLTPLVRQWHRSATSSGSQPATPFSQFGVELRLGDRGAPPSGDVGLYPSDYETFSGISATDGTAPVLEVRYWPRVSGSSIVSPAEGAITGRRVRLQAERPAGLVEVTRARFEYQSSQQLTWAAIPPAALQRADGSQPQENDFAFDGDRTPGDLVWDLQATPNVTIDGSVRVRAVLIDGDVNSSYGGVTALRSFELDRKTPDVGSSVAFGPGSLNVLTGDLAIASVDASMPAFLEDLTFTRTYHTRGGRSRTTDWFGPGWTSGFATDSMSMPYKSLFSHEQVTSTQELVDWQFDYERFVNDSYDSEELDPADYMVPVYRDVESRRRTVTVERVDGGKLVFRRDDAASAWTADNEAAGMTLSQSGSQFTLRSQYGEITLFTQDAAGSGQHTPRSYTPPGSPEAFRLVYTSPGAGKALQLSAVVSATPGTTCTTLTLGCRGLEFGWVALPNVPSMRLGSVRAVATDGTRLTLASYEYNTAGQLVRFFDPRKGAQTATTYTYDSAGRLKTLTPPGEDAWTIGYQAPSAGNTGDAGTGRVDRVGRPHPTWQDPDGRDPRWTAVYDVPTRGSGAPYELSKQQTDRWAQPDAPVDATAIFPPEQIPNGSSFTKATVYYFDADGREVNVAEHTADGPSISMTAYTQLGNVRRELTAANRARALANATGTSPADVLASERDWSQRLSTVRKWERPAGAPIDKGEVEVEVLEPEDDVLLRSGSGYASSPVRGRRYVETVYDEGSPNGARYDLPTSVQRGVVVDGQRPAAERQRTEYRYSNGTDARGWQVRKPLRVIEDPSAGQAALTTNYTYDSSYPLLMTEQSPAAAGGTDPRVRRYIYNSLFDGSQGTVKDLANWCWVARRDGIDVINPGELCAVVPATQTSSGPPVLGRYWAYDKWGNVTQERHHADNTVSTATKNRLTTYDAAWRPVTVQLQGPGTVPPNTTHTYNSITGQLATSSRSTTPPRTITRVHDSNGRLASYTDGLGVTTTRSYDRSGRLATVTDPAGTRSYTYDDRGLISGISDPQLAAPISYEYDADGLLVRENLPNGLSALSVWDPAGRKQRVRYEKANCTTACTWADDEVRRDAQGRIATTVSDQQSPTAFRSKQVYRYDGPGRLNRATDQRGGKCTVRTYTYDANANRTQRAEQTSASGGACDTGATITQALTYNNGDHLTNTGTTYDTAGRITTLPAALSGMPSALTTSYAADDLPENHTAGTTYVAYRRDPLRRPFGVDRVNPRNTDPDELVSYSDDSDEVAQTTTAAGTHRILDNPQGDLTASLHPTDTRFALRNVHNDVIGWASATPAASAPASRMEYDEFGRLRDTPTPGSPWSTTLRISGWLGGYARTSTIGGRGPIEMGVRQYIPELGRFLQTDPVVGGAANLYDYALQDPTNRLDLSGRCVLGLPCPKVVKGGIEGVKRAAKKVLLPYCLAKAVWRTRAALRGAGLVPGDPRDEARIRRMLLRNAASCTPEVGEFIDDAMRLLGY